MSGPDDLPTRVEALETGHARLHAEQEKTRLDARLAIGLCAVLDRDNRELKRELGEELATKFNAQTKTLQALHDTQSEHGDMLRTHGKALDDVRETQLEQGHTLHAMRVTQAEHSKVLGEHSTVLGEHTKILGEHSNALTELRTTQAEHSTALAELRAKLDQVIVLVTSLVRGEGPSRQAT